MNSKEPEDIPQKIISHCVALGFPQEIIPDEQYLRKIIRSRNTLMFDAFLQRTAVKSQVDCIRKNIIVHTSKDDKTPRNKLPIQMQRFFKLMKLKEELKDITKTNSHAIQREQALLAEIHSKTIRLEKIKESQALKDQKVNILKAKNFNLDDELQKASDFAKKIEKESIPKFHSEIKVSDLKDRTKECLNLLKNFHSDILNSSEIPNVEKLWEKLRIILSSVPSFFIFQSILKEIEASNETLKDLDSSRLTMNSDLHNKVIEQLQKLVIVSGIESISQKNKLPAINKTCSQFIRSVATELEGLLETNGNDSSLFLEDEDIVGDFVTSVLAQVNLKGMNAYLNQLISDLKRNIRNEEATVQSYNNAQNHSLKLNNLIGEKILHAQQSIAQMHQINQKLNLSKISMMHLVQDLKVTYKFQGVHMSSLSQATDITGPSHLNELQQFLQTPIEKFMFVGNVVGFEMRGAILFPETGLSSTLVELKKNDRSSLKEILDLLHRCLKMNINLISASSSIIRQEPHEPIEFSTGNLITSLNENREQISELLDEISKTNVATKSLLRDQSLIYKYSCNNSYKKFIPDEKKFNGKSFKAYENEFNLYYRMIKD